ncbi:hypothetical protein BJ085DRAFT_29256 [Dimargaris cristalligena]|uniref:Uncharacterized protein n=1 Tax=Dimargaris cristalligena TaxID=215637 RepID=A0A4P9ZQ13_9FUNG|nr:hypothetical protein BJ085DRAFT_29256 [Dimargaris cristalligena]|eukprot:RKP34801.1 hypothetical protein BJ085DRAFT_29256 [Dimargaris cristalligena]
MVITTDDASSFERPSLGLRMPEGLGPWLCLPTLSSDIPKTIVPNRTFPSPLPHHQPSGQAQKPSPLPGPVVIPSSSLSPPLAHWDKLKYLSPTVNPLYCWENTESPKYRTEGIIGIPRFFSELCTIDKFNAVYQKYSTFLLLRSTQLSLLDDSSLIRDIYLMLNGVPSSTFTFDSTGSRFTLAKRFVRLRQYSHKSLIIHWGKTGDAFAFALTEYLSIVHKYITQEFDQLRRRGELTLLALYHQLRESHDVLKFIASFCYSGTKIAH